MMFLIPNATNDWTKSKLFLPAHPKISKVVYKKTLSRVCYMKPPRGACMYYKRMLIAQDCVTEFYERRARAHCMTEISCKPGCAGKNNLDFIPSLVAFGISNICSGGAGKARFNVATPTYASVTCTAYVLLYNLQTISI